MENELAMQQNNTETTEINSKTVNDILDTNSSPNNDKTTNLDSTITKNLDKSLGLASSASTNKPETKAKENVPEANGEGSYEKIMKYLKTQEDAEKKRSDVRPDDVTIEKNNTQMSSKTIDPILNNNIISDLSRPAKQKNIDGAIRSETLDAVSKDSEVIPDKPGFKSVGIQTEDINTCKCCCTCKKVV